jgi:hypothetical protein
MKRFDLSKVLFYGVVTCVVVGGAFVAGLYSGASRNVLYVAVAGTKDAIENSVLTLIGEASTLSGQRPRHFLQPSRYSRDGVTVNDTASDQHDLILVSGFEKDTNELRLIRRNGDVVARWPVQFSKIFPNPTHFPEGAPSTDWNVDTHGALALPDGSVVFNFEWSGLVKLDRCGRVVWTVPRQTHHSVERAEGGGFWVPGRRVQKSGESPFPPFEPRFVEDTILKVSDDGRVLSEVSVPGIIYRNGLEALLTAGVRFTPDMDWDEEIVHLNDIQELPSSIAKDFPMFEAGDLVLSSRDQNLVLVVDKTAATVKWWRIGPWLRQHDPEFKPGGALVVFNNNVYETTRESSTAPRNGARQSNILELNPATGEHRVLFGGKPGQELLTVIRGKVELTRQGGLLITEFEGGRVLETDVNGKIVWEYIRHYDRDSVAELTEARVYPADYFTVQDWTCN